MEKLLSKEHASSDYQGNDASYDQESDGSLINQAFHGDPLAFEHLVSRYSQALFVFVRRHISDEQVEDIVQSVFLQLYLSLPQLSQHLSYTRSALPLRSWLLLWQEFHPLKMALHSQSVIGLTSDYQSGLDHWEMFVILPALLYLKVYYANEMDLLLALAELLSSRRACF